MSSNNDPTQQTANASSTPMLCKSGCGFFGSDATGGCCSKCFMEALKSKPAPPAAKAGVKKAASSANKPEPMEICQETTSESRHPHAEDDSAMATEPVVPAAAALLKKKKKKASYKSMLASMMTGDETNKDVAKEREEALSKVTGGGAFSKIEKI